MYKLIIGVDVSKGSLDMTAIESRSGIKTHDSFLNKQLGFSSFKEWLKEFGVGTDEILICMEHTGLYIFSLCDYLRKNGFTFSVVNPLQIKRSMGVQRVKTDKRDSLIIAQYALKFTEDLVLNTLESKDLMKLKMLNAQRERLLKQVLATEKVNKELADTLDKELVSTIIKGNLSILKILKKQLKEIENSIKEMVKEQTLVQRNFELIQTVPGVGSQVALHMILYSHNFQRITDPRKFGSYAGVVPNAYESGTSIKGRARVSHFANKKMKSLLHMAALSAVKHDGDLKQYYERKVAEGKSKMSVLNAIRNKLVHRMYSVIKRQTPYFNYPVINTKNELVLS